MNNKLLDMSNLGNFTKIAVKKFEENIVNKTNYLESLNNSNLGEEYDFKEDKNE